LQVAAVQGDGYKGNKSPHTDFERFEGVSLGRAALVRMKYSTEVLISPWPDLLPMYFVGW